MKKTTSKFLRNTNRRASSDGLGLSDLGRGARGKSGQNATSARYLFEDLRGWGCTEEVIEKVENVSRQCNSVEDALEAVIKESMPGLHSELKDLMRRKKWSIVNAVKTKSWKLSDEKKKSRLGSKRTGANATSAI